MARLWLILFLLLCAPVVYAQEQPPDTTANAPKQRLLLTIKQYKILAEANRWYILKDTMLLRPGQPSNFVPWL